MHRRVSPATSTMVTPGIQRSTPARSPRTPPGGVWVGSDLDRAREAGHWSSFPRSCVHGRLCSSMSFHKLRLVERQRVAREDREADERRSRPASPRRAPPAADPAPGAGNPALGRRDRRAGRHHPAGGLPAPAGPQGRRPGRRPPGRHPAPVPDPTRGPGIARPVPGRALAGRAPPAEGRRRVRHRRDRGGRRHMTASAPYTASVHIDADPERVFDHFTRPDAGVRWMGDYAALDPTPGGQFTLDLNGVPVRGRYLAVDRPRRLLLSWGTPALSGYHPAPPPWRSPSPPTTAAPP